MRSALGAIVRHNWRSSLATHESAQRTYALNDEAGLLLCSWPRGGRPAYPFVFSDEVWTGIEYQVAAHCIYAGLLAEGLAIVKGARDRHDGVRRNPWDEFECGHHYARAMSSWSVLLALSGYRYSAPQGHLAFAPQVHADRFRTFFSTGDGWGSFAQIQSEQRQEARIEVRHGTLALREVGLEGPAGASVADAVVQGPSGPPLAIPALDQTGTHVALRLPQEITAQAGQTLTLTLQW